MKDLKDLFKSFKYAADGILYCIGHERNMRIHLTCMLYMYSYLLFYDFFEVSAVQWGLILISNALVVGGELINTAIERAVDTATKENCESAKTAKDTAAGAVLIFAIFAVAVGISVLWQPEAFGKLFSYYVQNPLMAAAFVASAVLLTLFIFLPFGKGKKFKR
ncbi:MAG: diacylglycerol kinase family protein [Clostridiales bacterium]|nr:diacylglycerol kinase family protein [Clostridiales bacterium]